MACFDPNPAIEVSFLSSDMDIVETLLKSWNMGDYYPALKPNDIDFDLLILLDMQALDKLLPEVTYGKKLKLLQKIKELKELEIPVLQTSNDNILLDVDGNSELTSQACNGSGPCEILGETSNFVQPVVTENLHKASPEPVNKRLRNQDSEDSDFHPDSYEEDSDSDTPLIRFSTKKKKVMSSVSEASKQSAVCALTKENGVSSVSVPKETNISAALKLTDAGTLPEKDLEKKTNERLVNPNHLTEMKVAASSYKEALNKLDLKALLNESLEGKAILNAYATNELLEDEDRDSLTDILMKWVLLKNAKPSKDDYVLLREKILALFPKEINVYYFAPKEEEETQILARGKLFDRAALIVIVNKDNQVEDFIAGRRSDICSEFGGRAFVQPYILYVASAEQLNSPSCFYVVIDNFTYMFKSVVQALDVCFKVFIAMDLNYPVQCAHIWLLIQQYVYEVFTSDDESINNVKTFILKLKTFSKEP